MRNAIALTVLLSAWQVQPALAQGLTVYGGAAISFSNSDDTGTRGDFNAYVEADLANFYLGASGDIYNNNANNEIDLSLGYRNTLPSGLGYDISYTRFIYPDDGGDCCGGIDLILTMPFGDRLTGTLDTNYYPEDKSGDLHLSLDYLLSEKITLTGKVGVVQNVGADDTKEWEVAAKYALGEETAVKLHYYEGSDYNGYFGLDLTWDTTLLGG